jgi:hypothetical protein
VAKVEDALEIDGVGEEFEHVVRVARDDLFTREGLQEAQRGRRRIEVMGHGPARLSQGEQRALASFYAGRLPAGQLHAELCRAREAALAAAAARQESAESSLSVPAPALRAA